ncbi:MAG: hypothetical protein ABSA96_13960 [Candidatus Acidiferrales bacterium]|jgi:hypothetical protein
MNEVTAYILLALGFSSILLWLMRPARNYVQTGRSSVRQTIDQALESVAPHHYRYYPQVRQALSAGDLEYLRKAAPPHVAKKAIRERREVARHFLSGLYEDFSKLERLARMVAALSPVVSREQETERLLLGLRFRLLYAAVWLRLSLGPVPLLQLGELTNLVGRLAVRMEQAMANINALSAERFPRGLNA